MNLDVARMPSSTSVWLMRIYYLLWTGAGGFIFPFITLFYAQQGLSGTQIGWLSTIASLVSLISAPLIGHLSDNISYPRRVLQFCLLGSGVLILLLSQQTIFAWMALIVGVESFIGAPVAPLSDAQGLGISSETQGFGSIRLWGSLGWAVTSFVGGWMVTRAGLVSIFIGYAILYALCILVLAYVVSAPKQVHTSQEQRPPFRNILHSLVTQRVLLGLTVALTIFWISNYGRQQFETLYMKQLGANEQLIGWAYAYPALLELPIMLWADRLMRKHGSGKVLAMAILIEGVSLLGIVFAPTMTSMLILRAASGLYYSFYALASVAYAVENAPEGQGATILSLYYVTLNSTIALAIAPLSGALFDRMGAYPLYIIAATGTLIAWLALVISQQKPAPNAAQVL